MCLCLHEASSLEHVVDELTTLGYKVQVLRVNSSDYGLSQSRLRIFVVLIKVNSDLFWSEDLDAVMHNMVEKMRSFRCKPPGLYEMLFPYTDDSVRAEYSRKRTNTLHLETVESPTMGKEEMPEEMVAVIPLV